MKNKIQKWCKLKEFNDVWTPCEFEDTFGDPSKYDLPKPIAELRKFIFLSTGVM